MFKRSKIDDVFNRYVNNKDEKNDNLEIAVDSFTGEEIDSIKDDKLYTGTNYNEIDEIISKDDSISSTQLMDNTSNSDVEISEEGKEVTSFDFPSYLDMLTAIRLETEHPFSKIHTRSAEDANILLIDQLTTISMILRNISFLENNVSIMANNDFLKEFLFKLILAIGSNSEKFLFSRRKLGFLKDCLMIFMNIVHFMELRSVTDAFAAIVLVLSFGSDYNNNNDTSLFSDFNPQIHKYQHHAIDVLAKLLVRDPPNRSLIRSLVTGNFESLSVTETENIKNLISLYLGKDVPHYQFFTKIFKSIISVIPVNGIGSTILQESDAVISQSLLSAILISEMLDMESIDINLPLIWLSSSECIGSGFIRLGLVLASLSAKPESNQSVKLMSARCFELLNILIKKATEFIELNKDTQDFNDLKKTKLFLPSDSVLGAMLTSIDSSILNQILIFSSSLRKINSS